MYRVIVEISEGKLEKKMNEAEKDGFKLEVFKSYHDVHYKWNKYVAIMHKE